eukprot:gene39203-biopygen15068
MGAWAIDVGARVDAGVSYGIFGRRVTSAANAFTDIQLTGFGVPIPASVGFRIFGAASYDYSGWSVSNAGDINHDGIDDVVLGAIAADPPALTTSSNAGIVYVVFGKNMTGKSAAFGDVDLATFGPSSTIGFRILGAAVADRLGNSVSYAGDVNGDGISDIIVGANRADPSGLPAGSDAGISFVIFGRNLPLATAWGDIQLTTTALDTNVGFRILGAVVNDQSGFAVSSAGDVNDDGFDDIIIGAPEANAGSGASRGGISYIIYGRNIPGGAPVFGDIELSTVVSGSMIGFRILGDTANILSGSAVTTAGDWNADVFGKENFVFQNIDLNTRVTGQTIGFRILAAAMADSFGTSVSKAGDVNGDGVDDIILGANGADPPGKQNGGVSYVIFGRKVTSSANAFTDIQLPTVAMAASVGFRILGAAGSDLSGVSVSGAGDVNGDGIDDVIIGAYFADPPSLPASSDAGIVYVVFGKNMTGSSTAFGDIELSSIVTGSSYGFRILAVGAGDQLGLSVSRAGDVNNDGISDVIVAARNTDPTNFAANSNAGICYVIFGRKVTSPANAFGDIQLTSTALPSNVGFRIIGAAAGYLSGSAVSYAGDVNGDGIDDLLVGAGLADPPLRNDAGITAPSTQELSLSHLDNTRGFTMSVGDAMSSAGDINGDGVDDMIVGAAWWNANAGVAYVVFGRTDNRIEDIDFATRITGPTTGFRILPA